MTLGPMVSHVASFLQRYMWTPHTSTGLVLDRAVAVVESWEVVFPRGFSCGLLPAPWLSLVSALLSLELISYMLA